MGRFIRFNHNTDTYTSHKSSKLAETNAPAEYEWLGKPKFENALPQIMLALRALLLKGN